MPDINALYPQPPSGGLANMGIGQVVDVASGLNALEARQRELAANKALGAAVTGAPLTSSGVADPAAAWSAFRASPGAAYGPVALDAATRMQDLSRAQAELALKQRGYIEDRLGSVATDPTLTKQKATSIALDVLHGAGVPSAFIQQYIHDMPAGGDALRTYLGNLRSIAQGSAQGAARQTAPPVPGTLEPTQAPLSSFNYPQPGGGMPGQTTVGPAPGAAESKKTMAETGAGVAARLLSSASSIPEQRTQLDLMRADLATAGRTMGPTQAYETAANIVADRVLGITPTMTRQEIAAAQSFDKIAKNLALAQAGAYHASDESTRTAMGANPNSSLAGYSSEGIIDMLHGNYDAQDMKANEWTRASAAGVPDDQYFKWERQFNKDADPRVFQFMRMNPEQQGILLKSIKDKGSFEKHLLEAHGRGWITLPDQIIAGARTKGYQVPSNKPYSQAGLY